MDYYLSTEGVLVLCSSLGIKERYEKEEFNYDFPDSILKPINDGELAVIITETGSEVKVSIKPGLLEKLPEGYEKIGAFKINVKNNDRFYILSHAEFTQICDWHKGNIEKYKFYDEPGYIEHLEPGWYELIAYAKILNDEELESLEDSDEYYYIDFIINMVSAETGPDRVITGKDIPRI